MTIAEFATKHHVKGDTVKQWLEKAYIPGAQQLENGEWSIPNNARCPYTARRCGEGMAMFRSIVCAYSQGKNVVPSLYDITPEKLEAIQQALEEWGFIKKEELDGLTYYNCTPEGKDFISWTNSEAAKFIQNAVKNLSPIIAALIGVMK